MLFRSAEEDADGESVAADIQGTEAKRKVAIYLPPFYFSEVGVCKRLKQIYNAPAAKPAAEQLAMGNNIEYDPVQLQAIQTAVNSKIMILTGGPGTGKSTTTMGILPKSAW